MTTRTATIHEIIPNDEELKAIETLAPMLAELQDYFGTANFIQSVESGEVIKGSEIARTRSILDFIFNYRAVQVY